MRATRNLVRRLALSMLVLAVGACASSDDDVDDVAEGYVRFEPPAITVQPGESGQWVQYVANPFDEDMDIVDIVGHQGVGGHHAVLYSSPTVEEIGTTREWRNIDQLVDRFLGGLGGEGAEEISLPEGAVFRVPAGHALYINAHYFNATEATIEGWSRLDVKFEPADSSRIAVGLFANVTLAFEATPGLSEATATCTLERDVDLVMFTNHMHEWGRAVRTTMLPPGAGAQDEPQMIKNDPMWNYEWATNPNFESYSVEAPLRLAAGSQLTTTCSWDNTTGESLRFPDEMCLFLAFHIDELGDLSCVDGSAI
jgi:Copper type II ascorbate-dependent monooxygenase, C-terminal domain